MRYTAAIVAMLMVLWLFGYFYPALGAPGRLAFAVATLGAPWLVLRRWPK
jgi:hypothetical protein